MVTAPLTYAALEDKSTAALLGIKLNHALTPKANLTASLGVEQDLNHKVDQQRFPERFILSAAITTTAPLTAIKCSTLQQICGHPKLP